MAESSRRQSLFAKNRPSAVPRRLSQVRLPPFNAEREAIEFFYRRERSTPSLPKRVLEQVFGSEFVERLLSRAPAFKKRACTANQFEDLSKWIRIYLRQILTAEAYFAKALQMLPGKAFSSQPVPVQKPRMSIFGGGRRLSVAQKVPSYRNMNLRKKTGGGLMGWGQMTKSGKKVAPVDQVVVEDPSTLKQMMNVVLEDYNPNAPVNVTKFNMKAGIVIEDHDISQSETVFYQKGTKIHKESTRGRQLVDERIARYPPGPDGIPLAGPRRRYNYIESISRPQQIWQRHSYEIASQTESMPISNFRVKIRTYAINDLYAADVARKKSGESGDHKPQDPTHQSSIAVAPLNDEEKLAKVKADYEASWRLVLVPMHKDVEDVKRKVAHGAEWPVHIAPTKLISLEKQTNIQHIFRGLKLTERLILQPFHRPISADYRYFEDLLDNGRKTGSLLPLWNVHHPRLKDVKVENAMWHPRYPDMFVCSGGRDEVWDPQIGPGQTAGFVCWFSLRNPTYPEYLHYVAKPVMMFDIHHKGFILAAGTNDGNILYINLGIRSDGPVAETSGFDEYHTRAITAVKFIQDNGEGDTRFFTAGLEGNFREWTIEKHTIIPTRLLLSSNMPGFFHNPNWHLDQPHCVAFSTYQRNIFLIGTLFGFIHLCNYDVFQHVKHSWRAHELPVSAVRWSPFHKDVFMSCGYDYKINIFDLENLNNGPILKWNFDVGVRDVAWAPYNSTIFAALLTDGQLLVYDLSHSKYTPICSQSVAVTSKSRPERVRFNNWGPYILVSDRSGSVQIFKLSPNLRKIEVQEQAIGAVTHKTKGAPAAKKKMAVRSGRYPGIDLKTQVGKMERLLAIYRDVEPPTLKLDVPMKKYITIGGEQLSTKLSDGMEITLSSGSKKDSKVEKEKPEVKKAPPAH